MAKFIVSDYASNNKVSQSINFSAFKFQSEFASKLRDINMTLAFGTDLSEYTVVWKRYNTLCEATDTWATDEDCVYANRYFFVPNSVTAGRYMTFGEAKLVERDNLMDAKRALLTNYTKCCECSGIGAEHVPTLRKILDDTLSEYYNVEHIVDDDLQQFAEETLKLRLSTYLTWVASESMADGDVLEVAHGYAWYYAGNDPSWASKFTSPTFEGFKDRTLLGTLYGTGLAEMASEVRKTRKKAVMLLKEIRDTKKQIEAGTLSEDSDVYRTYVKLDGTQPIKFSYKTLINAMNEHVVQFRNEAISLISGYLQYVYGSNHQKVSIAELMRRAAELVAIYDKSLEGPEYLHSLQWKLYHDLCLHVHKYTLKDEGENPDWSYWQYLDRYEFKTRDDFAQYLKDVGLDKYTK